MVPFARCEFCVMLFSLLTQLFFLLSSRSIVVSTHKHHSQPDDPRPLFNSEAHVACRQLGYKGISRIYPHSISEPTKLPIMAANIQCQGNEHTLSDCTGNFSLRGLKLCKHTEDVGLECAGDDSQAVDSRIRIQHGGPSGRLEVYVMEQTSENGRQGQWGTVCAQSYWMWNAAP